MEFARALEGWEFSRREKRFFMYGREPGQVAHCPNTGSLRGVVGQCERLWVSDHGEDCGRKLRYTAEICELRDGVRVGINTGRANRIAEEAVVAGIVPGIVGPVLREVVHGPGCRFDLKVGEWWVEVKNTTLAEDGTAMFPDAVTERGRKHLETLGGIVASGGKALQIFVVARGDVEVFKPADAVDPLYGMALRQAVAAGVQVVALRCSVGLQGISVDKVLPVVF